MKPIIDVCCGSRMFWFDRKNPKVVFMDNRTVEQTLCDGRKLEIKPDVVGDFRDEEATKEAFDKDGWFKTVWHIGL